jgi:hypothetical protein
MPTVKTAVRVLTLPPWTYNDNPQMQSGTVPEKIRKMRERRMDPWRHLPSRAE